MTESSRTPNGALYDGRFQEETRQRSRQNRMLRSLAQRFPLGMVPAKWIEAVLDEPVNDGACEPRHPFKQSGQTQRIGLLTIRADNLGHKTRPAARCDCGRIYIHPVHEEGVAP